MRGDATESKREEMKTAKCRVAARPFGRDGRFRILVRGGLDLYMEADMLNTLNNSPKYELKEKYAYQLRQK